MFQIATGLATSVAYTVASGAINSACNKTWEKTVNPVMNQIPVSDYVPEMVKDTAKAMTKRTVKSNILKGFVPFAATGLTQYAGSLGITNSVTAAASVIGASPVLLGGVAVAGVAGIAAGAAITYACCRNRKEDNEYDMAALAAELKKNREKNTQPKRLQSRGCVKKFHKAKRR